jgi:hypothetical protein
MQVPRTNAFRRGAASVEAVVALPVFALLFVGILYLDARFTARNDAEGQARSCAWLYSAANCANVPVECEGIVTTRTTSGLVPDAVANAVNGGDGKLRSMGALVTNIVDGLLGRALGGVFGRSLDAAATRTVERPMVFGGRTIAVVGRYYLPCNLEAEEAESVAKDAWDIFRP